MTAFPQITPGASPTSFRWSLAAYHAAIAAGILTENDRVELINGEIIQRMAIGQRHADCVNIINLFFILSFGKAFVYSVQNPVAIDDHSEPEPDYAIIDRSSYADRPGKPRPADVRLLVEVSDGTLDYDRSTKMALYATAGISEYWIINLQADQVEVHTAPDAATGTYRKVMRYDRTEQLDSPFCGQVAVADVLPEAVA